LREHCGEDLVGRWYGPRKEWRRVVVCCLPSVRTFRAALEERGEKVGVWIADEVHKCLPFTEQIEACRPARRVGFTATPFRTAKSERLRGFDHVIGRVTIADATAAGDLVPFTVVRFDGEPNEDDFDADCLSMLKEHAVGPTVFDAEDIADAERFAERLRENGLASDATHSRLPKTRRAELLEALRTGELAALGHVALLVEGVDLPWLQTLLIRRNTSSPVRVTQQLGRILRTAPGKDRAWVLDPLDVLGRVGIKSEADLDRIEEEEAEEEVEPQLREGDQETERALRVAVAIEKAEEWLADLLLEAELAGIQINDSSAYGTGWRSDAPTPRQLQALRDLTENGRRSPVKFLPQAAREPMRSIVRNADHLDKGTVSDLLNLLYGLRRAAGKGWGEQRRRWTWPYRVAITVPDSAIGGLDEVQR
jgi:superfamily II DNA or RNA helicase